nr:uncharacterized mitochondrial protein AtMg00810-like [Aegilops tauschii subsp. strangulata]
MVLCLCTGTNDIAYVLLYVDDIVLAAFTDTLLRQLVDLLQSEFALKDLGTLHYFMGVEITRSPDGFFLCQKKYALELLEHAGMSDCKAADTLGKMHAPRDAHWALVKRIFCYVCGSAALGLTLHVSSSLDIIAYSKAD